jgi:hypothetical protein
MKNSNVSILLEKYQTEKRKRILRYSSKMNNSQLSTISTNVNSTLVSSKMISNVDNYELSFVLASLKSVSNSSPSERKFYMDGAEKYKSMKENQIDKAGVRKIFTKTQQTIIQSKAPERLAYRYHQSIANEVRFPNVVPQSDLRPLASNERASSEEDKLSHVSSIKSDEDANSNETPTVTDENDEKKSKNESEFSKNKNVMMNAMTDNMIFSGLCKSPDKNAKTQIGGNRTSIVGIIKVLDSELQTDNSISKSIKGERLPFTMKEFPEDVNPSEFFLQKQSTFHSYITYIRKNFHYMPTLPLYHFHRDFSLFFNSYSIQTKHSKGATTTSYLPLGAAYFLVNCPEVAQLFFAHQLIHYYLNTKQPIPVHVKFKDFEKILSKLNGEVDISSRMSVLSKKSIQRKSMFSNQKVNYVFEEQEDANESNGKGDKANNSDEERNKNSMASPVISPFMAHEQAISDLQKVAVIREEVEKDSNSESDDSKSSNSDSDSDSESKSSNSSDDDSLSEVEYNTKNPFILKFSKIVYKFQTYELKVIQPTVTDSDGKSEKITSEILAELLYDFNNFNHEFFLD